MSQATGIILLNIAALTGSLGTFWQSWDHHASAPIPLLIIALVMFGIGGLLS